jgi:hypothetical protein
MTSAATTGCARPSRSSESAATAICRSPAGRRRRCASTTSRGSRRSRCRSSIIASGSPIRWFGGQFELQLNTLAIGRTAGQDTQRAFAGARWDLRGLTGLGQEVTLTALVRGDVYHSDENLLTAIPGYRGKSGWQARGIAAIAADMRWPFVGEFMGGTQTLTPRVQIVATPPIKNLDIPNEDSRAFDLEDSNLFAINRFNGHDRFEDGARITYGVEWNFSRPGFNISSVVGQSYRLSDKPSLFPDGTGLTDRTSDIVGRTTVAYRDFLRLTHRYRLDKDNLAVRRNEFDATIGSRSTYAVLGYSRLNRDILLLGEELQDREEARVGGRVAVAKNWSVFGSAIVDLTQRTDDPLSSADGFEPIRHRLGVAYDDECLSIALTWRRDYADTGDARRGNSFRSVSRSAIWGSEGLRAVVVISPPACGRGRGWVSNVAIAHPAAASQQAGKPRCPSRKREGKPVFCRNTPPPSAQPRFSDGSVSARHQMAPMADCAGPSGVSADTERPDFLE